jgi:hypothetical protein
MPPLAAAAHGPLMVSGFLGTLMALERAATGRRAPAIAAASLSAITVLLLLAGLTSVAQATLLLAALVFAVVVLQARHPKVLGAVRTDGLTPVAGAGAWVVGNLVWMLGGSISQAVPWWTAFLVLSISGERLELAPFQLLPTDWRAYQVAVAAVLGGAGVGLLFPELGVRLTGLGLLLMGAWLLQKDPTPRELRATGRDQYAAACTALAYGWLVVGGLLWVALPGAMHGGPQYDALLHAVFVGFVLSMAMGHGPIMLPVLAGVNIVFGRVFYLPVVLLHGGLALRLWGDLMGDAALRRWGGLANATGFVVFLLIMAAGALAGRGAARSRGGGVGAVDGGSRTESV